MVNNNNIVFWSVISVALILAIGAVSIGFLTKPPPRTHPCEQESGRNDPRCIGWYTRNH